MKENYYTKSLNAHKLFAVYQTRHARVKQYLVEITFVKRHLYGTGRIVELGTGYARIMKALALTCASITSIDISADNYVKNLERNT